MEAMLEAMEARSLEMEAAKKRQAAYIEYEFRKKLIELHESVVNFIAAYANGNGNIWPAKKAEAVKKAYIALKKADVRFDDDK
jgi:hypothetical protein